MGFGFAMIIGWRVMSVNTYLSRSVRIQEERGHQVITSGPYRFVRHPMYVGALLFVLCIPMVLDSIWAFIPSAVIVILFIIRTALEDRTLIEKLPGYAEYTKRVKYRLIPFVW
jgi:protein-S-isoprenylcysteine O-methyltransferase Ste14